MHAPETEITAEKAGQQARSKYTTEQWSNLPGTGPPGQGAGLAGWSCGGDLKGFGATRHRCVLASNPKCKLPSPTGSEHPVLAYSAKTQPALHGTLRQW